MSSEPARRAETVPAAWPTAAEAAEMLGRSKRTILLWCATGRLAARRIGGQWYVDPEAAPELRIASGAPVVAALAGGELAGLSDRARARIHERYAIVRAYLGALRAKGPDTPTGEFAAAWVELWRARHPGRRLSRSALYNWLGAYRRRGIAGLIDRRHRNGCRGQSIHAEEWGLIRGLYLSEAQISIPYIYELAAAQAAAAGRTIPTLRTVQRHIARRLDPKVAAAGREPRKFRDRCIPYIRRDWTTIGANEVWIADHRQFDVWVPAADDRGGWTWRRPILTAYIDGRTWKLVGSAIDFGAPNGDRVMGAFARAAETHGLPKAVTLDNGKDFRNTRFAGGRPKRRKPHRIVNQSAVKPLLAALGVDVHWAIPYNARAKVIEPFFGIVAKRFDKTWETYCGSRPNERPERLKGMRADEYHAATGLSIETFRAAFAAWGASDYERAASPAAAAGGLSPAEAFARLRAADYVERRVASEDLALLLRPSVAVTVTQNGVWVRHFGRYYWAEELEDRRAAAGRDRRRKVRYRYRPDDPSMIWVFDAMTDKFLAVAAPYVGNSISPLADDGDERARLVECMSLQRDLARRAKRTVADLRAFAGNRLLTAHAAAVRRRTADDPARLVPQPAAASVIVRAPQMARAAAAGRDRQRQQDAESSAIHLMATGTEDQIAARTAEPQPEIDPVDLLAAPAVREPHDERHDAG